MWYFVAQSDQILAITGAGVDDVRVVKKSIIWPWQKCRKISLRPFDVSIELTVMSVEKLSFQLPANFTIGAGSTREALEKYARLLSGSANGGGELGGQSILELVKGVIEGETRSLVASMTMEELCTSRGLFKENVNTNIQKELDQFGLYAYNANIKELQDAVGYQYFSALSRKAHEGAVNKARVDVAKAQRLGSEGEAEERALMHRATAKIETFTNIQETERQMEKAAADAKMQRHNTELQRDVAFTKLRAERDKQTLDAQLETEVQRQKAEAELFKRRAVDVVQSKITREQMQEDAEASYFSKTKDAEAGYYAATKDADAKAYLASKEAQTASYAVQQQATGYEALATGIAPLVKVLGGADNFMRWAMIEKGVYQNLADASARATNGLQPKISIWTTGKETGADAATSVAGLMKSLAPTLATIEEQTGIAPPLWLANRTSRFSMVSDGTQFEH